MATIILAFAVLVIELVLLVITLLKFVKIYMKWGRSNEPAVTRGTSILGEVRNVEISRATQQLSSCFYSSTLNNQSNCIIFG